MTFHEAADAAAEATATPAAATTIEAKGPDGTRYTLTIPKGAVSEDTRVRVVPLVDVSGIPGGGPAVAARLEPDGTQFAKPLRLAIDPGVEIARSERFPFTAADDGSDVGPAPAALGVAGPTVLVAHFSVAGVAGVNDSALDAAIGVAGGDLADQIYRQAGEVMEQSARGDISEDKATSDVTELLDRFDREVAQPALDALGSKPNRCAAIKELTSRITDAMRMRQMFGLPDSKLDVVATIGAAYKDCEREAIRRCKKARDPGPLVRFWLDQARTAALFGGSVVGDPAVLEEKARPICVPQRYRASGGGNGVTITGEVPDITRPFVLSGRGDGFSITLRYTPADDTGRSGTMTYEGSGGGVPLAGSSSYTITGEDGKVLTLTETGSGCAGPDCAGGTEVVTLTPIR